MAPVLQFEAVNKRYRSFVSRREIWALLEFGLAMESGEIVGFLGPNGAVKPRLFTLL
ncbi:MAG TPA: hypothetical protein VFQ00_00110 [Terriglobales bacterium]|nr:hypothetical protein [Terriglobales bacterium]